MSGAGVSTAVFLSEAKEHDPMFGSFASLRMTTLDCHHGSEGGSGSNEPMTRRRGSREC